MTKPGANPSTRKGQDLICPVITSITVIILVLLNAPSMAYIVLAGACGATAVNQLRRN